MFFFETGLTLSTTPHSFRRLWRFPLLFEILNTPLVAMVTAAAPPVRCDNQSGWRHVVWRTTTTLVSWVSSTYVQTRRHSSANAATRPYVNFASTSRRWFISRRPRRLPAAKEWSGRTAVVPSPTTYRRSPAASTTPTTTSPRSF